MNTESIDFEQMIQQWQSFKRFILLLFGALITLMCFALVLSIYEQNIFFVICILCAIIVASFPIISEYTQYNPIDYMFNTARRELLRTFEWMKYHDQDGKQIILYVTKEQMKFAFIPDVRLEKLYGSDRRGFKQAREIWKHNDSKWEPEFLDKNNQLLDKYKDMI